MNIRSPKTASSLISFLFHAAVLLILLFFVGKGKEEYKQKYIEVGFGGIVNSNSPGSPGSGTEENPPPEKKEQPKVKIREKHHNKPKETIPEKKIKKIPKPIKNPAADSSASASAVQAAASGSGGETGNGHPGEGGNGNGAEGSAPAKKGPRATDNNYLVAVDQMPVPYGGAGSINAKAYYPPAAKAAGIKGTVYVQAFIDQNGNVAKVILLKGIGGGCDQSAVRAVKDTRFQPGMQGGVPVKVRMTISINFGLGG